MNCEIWSAWLCPHCLSVVNFLKPSVPFERKTTKVVTQFSAAPAAALGII